MKEYPYPEGDMTVLGPEIFAAGDESVICWRGVNYVKQETAISVRDALRELVTLKDGPRGDDYQQRKPLAWEAARKALKDLER